MRSSCMRQGEGDCDWWTADTDCCDGLVCDFDWGWKTDYCVAGPETVNYSWGAWSEWSECSVACGGTGTRSRSRECIPPIKGGHECPTQIDTETEACDAPACWTAYGEWSDCTGECDTTGSRNQTRTCIPPTNGGQPCPEVAEETRFEQCPTEACWTPYGEWSDCTGVCDATGSRSQTRTCIPPTNGGQPCPEVAEETKFEE